MTWAKLDDGFTEHPKVIGLSDGAFRLHVHGICYSARNLTSGHVPTGALRALRGTRRQAEQLVAVGVWELGDDGWLIHDYLAYNPSGEQVKAERTQVSEARRQAGVQSGAARRKSRTKAEQTDEQNGNKTGTKREPRTRTPSPTPSVSPSSPTETSAQRASPEASPSFWDAAKRFHEAKPKEQVARLIDLGYTLGFERSGHAAAIVRRYGHGREIVRAALAYRENNGAGDPWEYMERVLQRDTEKARQGNARSGPDGSGGEGALPVLTAAEASELLREEAVHGAGSGDGPKAPSGRAVRKGRGSRDSLQRSGRDDG